MKKIIALILVMLLSFSLVGCKSKGYTDDEEVAVIAGDETQVDINETISSEQTNENTDNQASNNTVDEQPSVEKAKETTTEKKINQVELENQPYIEEDTYDWWLTFNNIADFVTALKTKKYVDITPEKDRINNPDYERTQNIIKLDEQKGILTDYRFDLWNIDKIEYFYKIKDISGYELRRVSISGDRSIQFFYYPISSDKSTYDDELEIYVSYRRVDTIITDSYFNDYLEYYGDKNLTEDGFIFIKYDSDNYATIIFPVENTIIEIRGHGNMANYKALKKLCVAEKVVVE